MPRKATATTTTATRKFKPERHVPKGTYAGTADPLVDELRTEFDKKEMPTRLAEILARRNVTHRELGEMMGLSPGAIRHRVYGRTPLSLSDALLISELIGVPFDELVGDRVKSLLSKEPVPA